MNDSQVSESDTFTVSEGFSPPLPESDRLLEEYLANLTIEEPSPKLARYQAFFPNRTLFLIDLISSKSRLYSRKKAKKIGFNLFLKCVF